MSKAFISYSHADEKILERLKVHMAVLKREGKIESWHDKDILAGADLGSSIDNSLNNADIFLAIVSPDYLNSSYCYDIEFSQALERHGRGDITIIPIIAQPCDWKHSSFGKMKAIPKDGKAISEWTNDNNAYLNIIDELRRILDAKQFPGKQPGANILSAPNTGKSYKIKRDFTEVDKVNFKDESFLIIRKYFTEAIEEVNGVEQIQARFLEDEKKSFTCIIANRSKINSTGYISITTGGSQSFGRSDLSYSFSENTNPNSVSIEKNFTIDHDDYHLFWSLRSMFTPQKGQIFSAKEIAEKLWLEFVDQVGLSY